MASRARQALRALSSRAPRVSSSFPGATDLLHTHRALAPEPECDISRCQRVPGSTALRRDHSTEPGSGSCFPEAMFPRQSADLFPNLRQKPQHDTVHRARHPCPLLTPSMHARRSSSVAAEVAAVSTPAMNQGILVELGVIPPYDPAAELERQRSEIIFAYRRCSSGKINSSKERRAGRVPSVIFEQANGHLGGNKQLIAVDAKQIAALLRKYGRSRFMSRAFEIRIFEEGEEQEAAGSSDASPAPDTAHSLTHRVLPKSVHEHAGTDKLLNVTFLKKPPTDGARVKVQVPLQFVGEDACPGIRKGGWLFCMRRVVPYECSWDSIPPYIEVDLSTMRVGQILVLRDLKVDPSCRLLVKDSSLPVCKIAGSKSLEAGSE